MTKRLLAAALAALALTACGGGGGSAESDLAACEQAMREQFEDAAQSGTEGERPAECEGVSDEQLEDIATEIIGDALSD